jgi:hypothetical protein
MRVETTVELFQTDEHVEHLLALLRHFSEKRHDWAVDPLDVETVEAFLERNVPRLAPVYKALAKHAALRQAAYATPKDGRPVRISPADVADHVSDLSRPAVVMVEDDANDGGFIKVIAKVFGESGLLLAIEKDWLVIDHGGGTPGVFRRAPEARGRFRRLSRVAVVLDSDRKVPDDPPDHDEDIAKLRAADVKTHVLKLREIENYIPDKALRLAGPQCRPETKVAALAHLTKDQRGYYDMKSGFRGGTIPACQQTLYDGVPDEVVQGLAGGFGRQVIKTFIQHADQLTEDDFRNDAGSDIPAELRAMLAMIREIV